MMIFLNFFNTHKIRSIRKTLAEIDAEGELQADGTLVVYVATEIDITTFNSNLFSNLVSKE